MNVRRAASGAVLRATCGWGSQITQGNPEVSLRYTSGSFLTRNLTLPALPLAVFRFCPRIIGTMSIPKVAIVGRPNVGKSSLFNWLIGQRVSVVDPTAGVTRDRVSFLLDLNDEEETPQLIELIDTGGIGIVDEDNLSEHIEEQIQIALRSADLILICHLINVRPDLFFPKCKLHFLHANF